MDRSRILVATVVIEGALFGAFLVWSYLRRGFVIEPIDRNALLLGALSCLPLMALNLLLFDSSTGSSRWHEECRRFRDQVVRPLISALDPKSALVVSICAGVGEEFFFRGLVQYELGLVIASILFAVLHFGTAVQSYPRVTVIYCLIGLYFGFIAEYAGSVWPAAICHGLYDFLAVTYLRSKRSRRAA